MSSAFVTSTTPSTMANFSLGNDTLPEATAAPGYTTVQATLIGLSAALLSSVTITGNFMVMVSFKMDKQLQTISNYFLFSLAVADMIIGMISMPFYTAYILQQQWIFGRVLCDAYLSVDYLASNASVLNLLVISFDRYFSVTRPLTYRARRTTKKAALMIFSAWAISAVVWPPWIIAWPYIEGKRTVPDDDCYIQFIYSNEYMSIVTVMIAFFVPVSVMIGLYVRVWWETVKRQRELVHLQAAGRKVNSKRSDSSDETADDAVAATTASRFVGRWRGHGHHGAAAGANNSGGVGGVSSNNPQGGSDRSKESQDLTYMPTSMFKTRASATSLVASHAGEQASFGAWFSDFMAACCVSLRDTAVSDDGGSSVGTRGGSQRGFGVGTGGFRSAGADASSEGYTTPRSLDTPVQMASKCASLNHIRDPYATRIPVMLRQSDSVEERMQQQHPQRSSARHHYRAAAQTPPPSTAPDSESIYTIVIQFPSSSSSASSKHESNGRKRSTSPTTRHQKSKSEEFHPKRVPSIKMLPEDAANRLASLSGRHCDELDDDDDDIDPATAAAVSTAQSHHAYPRSLPIVRRFDTQGASSASSMVEPTGSRRATSRSANPSATCSPTSKGLCHRQNWRGSDGANVCGGTSSTTPTAAITTVAASTTPSGSTNVAPATSLLSVASSGFKRPLVMTTAATKVKKATSEKKQDRKAAKTLSAILLAFIVTWTPYSVLVVINAILGKEAAEKYIPGVLWQFCYYLCYINSTVNPLLYALCNAAFRRTYVRILKCRWRSRARQPVNRYYYG